MKKYISLLLLTISYITMLNANESIKIDIFCSDSKGEELSIKISSDKLNLSEDAIQDNTGGYVDIPEDSYYLKTKSNLYYLHGTVANSNKGSINQFTSDISNDSTKFINIKELSSLKDSKDLKFIQKIVLENNNFKTNTTTNILDVYFDSDSFNKEYQRCKKQKNQPEHNLYLQGVLLILLAFGIFHLLKRNFRN